MVSNTGGIINQISHNPLRRGPSLGLARTRSAGRGASIGVATPMLTVPGSEGERGEGVRCEGGLMGGCVCKRKKSASASNEKLNPGKPRCVFVQENVQTRG